MHSRRKNFARRSFTPTQASVQQLNPISYPYARGSTIGEAGEEQAGDGDADEEEDS